MVKARKYVLHNHFNGLPKETDFKILEEDLPTIKDGEAVYLSVDPYMRSQASTVSVGETFIGSQVAKVLESKNVKYPIGTYVVGEFGWRSHTIADNTPNPRGFPNPWIIPDLEELPLSLALGVLGMPGNTAYFGFLEVCQPKPGQTVVVSAAGGAVGSIVGQIAKIKKCKVIGITGSDHKGKWLTDELKFDHFLNYKDKDFEQKLEEATLEGIDCYFDNVGGQISTTVIRKMNLFGRVAVCGAISGYNDGPVLQKVDSVYFPLLFNQLKMEGFYVHRWLDRWFEGIQQNKIWVKEEKLQYKESVTEGFNNMPKAFVDMLQGKNMGKAIIKV